MRIYSCIFNNSLVYFIHVLLEVLEVVVSLLVCHEAWPEVCNISPLLLFLAVIDDTLILAITGKNREMVIV